MTISWPPARRPRATRTSSAATPPTSASGARTCGSTSTTTPDARSRPPPTTCASGPGPRPRDEGVDVADARSAAARDRRRSRRSRRLRAGAPLSKEPWRDAELRYLLGQGDAPKPRDEIVQLIRAERRPASTASSMTCTTSSSDIPRWTSHLAILRKPRSLAMRRGRRRSSRRRWGAGRPRRGAGERRRGPDRRAARRRRACRVRRAFGSGKCAQDAAHRDARTSASRSRPHSTRSAPRTTARSPR